VIELWVVRHGETDWNVSRRIQGWTDIPLNVLGQSQAERLAEKLQGIPFQIVISSDLQRAYQTAKTLAAHIHCDVATNTLLREQCFGRAEGLLRDDVDRKFPHGAPDAESKQTLALRARNLLQTVSNQYASGRILCVSHGGMIRCILQVVGETTVPIIRNTSVSKLTFDGQSWRATYINWTEHLDNDLAPDHEVEGQVDCPEDISENYSANA